MRAFVLNKPAPIDQNPLVASDLPDPRPGAGEILIRVSACGVCHTDLHIAEGELVPPRYPIIPGHQVVGRVEALGEGVTGWKTGERAGVAWLAGACGQCAFCRRGEENLCPNAEFTGLHRNGGFADWTLARADFAVRLPDAFDDLHAAPLLCAGVIGYRALRVAGLQPGETIGLFGFGASAHLAIQIARHWGCRVHVFTRAPIHRESAQALGAAWIGSAEETPPEPLDRAVLFAPAGGLVPAAMQKLRPGGTLAVNAVYMTDIPAMPYQLLYGERTLRSVANATRRDAMEFLALAAAAGLKVDAQPYRFTEANLALQELKAGKIRGAGVLVLP